MSLDDELARERVKRTAEAQEKQDLAAARRVSFAERWAQAQPLLKWAAQQLNAAKIPTEPIIVGTRTRKRFFGGRPEHEPIIEGHGWLLAKFSTGGPSDWSPDIHKKLYLLPDGRAVEWLSEGMGLATVTEITSGEQMWFIRAEQDETPNLVHKGLEDLKDRLVRYVADRTA